jgi:hypothetical protein
MAGSKKSDAIKVAFHPGPSLGHELGIMFGFITLFVLATVVYYVMWQAGNKRDERTELGRREALAQKGFRTEKSGESETGYN